MSRCPKCGSTTIAGPKFVQFTQSSFGEALRYSCCVCGYSVDKPTKDAEIAAAASSLVTPGESE